ncbi:MAG: hypothetical protein EHM77_06555, partial [Planctomycetaceae bacterium]
LPEKGEKQLGPHMNLNNEVHQYIYDLDLPYEPVKLYTSLPMEKLTPTQRRTVPPNILPEPQLLGFTKENVHDSFLWSTLSCLNVYNCTLPPDLNEYRQKMVKKLHGVLANKLKDFTFKMDSKKYFDFIANFKAGKTGIDKDFVLAEALSIAISRPVIILSTLKRHNGRKMFKFSMHLDKPPIVLGLYWRGGYEIFLPFFLNKSPEFKIDHLKGKLEIVAYMSKTLPEGFKSRPILDLEVFALLTALYSMQRFISGVPVTLLTDNRVLYYLFSERVTNSSVKVKRWCLKLISDYPLITLQFVRTTENLADFLTREGLLPGDAEKFNLKNITIKDFYKDLPKTNFTISEWINFVNSHPEYLVSNDLDHTPFAAVVHNITTGVSNVKSVTTPLQILQEKLSKSEIVKRQKLEYAKIYTSCLAGKDFEFIYETEKPPNEYKLVGDLLMIKANFYKILVPPSMIGILLSHQHLMGHKGLPKMLANLESYYFPTMNTIVRKFIACCYACFLNHKGSRRQKIGTYPTPNRPGEEWQMDIAENLNKSGGYSHLLICQCVLSDFTVIVPLKSKTAEEVNRGLLNSILQQFNVEKLHSDNGKGFRGNDWLESMSALGIKIIASSSLHPQGRGQIERLVGTVKLLLRKLLANQKSLNWEYLPYIIAKVLNNSISPKTGFKPAVMIYGTEGAGLSFMENSEIAQPHYFVKSQTSHIQLISEEIQEMTKIATEKLIQLRLVTNEKLNKTRTDKNFKIGDIVFVLDRTTIPGSS